MTERNPLATGTTNPPPSATGYWQLLKVIGARLRFIAILVVIGVVLGSWTTITSYYEKWTRSGAEKDAASSDTEWYCPMHPFIVRDNRKEKCPVCHMDLAKRKKGAGDGEPLPAGTVSRVQLTPYRVVLAGVQTAEVQYLPLVKEITTFGSVEFNETREAHIATRQKARIVKLHVNYTGQEVKKGEELATLDVRYSPELTATLDDLRRARRAGDQDTERMAFQRLKLWDVGKDQAEEFLRTGKVNTEMTITSPIKGHVIKKYQREGNFVDEGTPLYEVVDLDSVWVLAQVYESDQALLRPGMAVRATALSLPNEVFGGTLDFLYPHLDEASRTLAVRFHIPNSGHRLRPGMYATVKIAVAPLRVGPFTRLLGEDWAVENATWLLAHGLTPFGPGPGAGILPLFQSAGRLARLNQGLLPAVPDSAVIDTGKLKIVYREAVPNTFEGVAVELGPRMALAGNATAFYPVLRGLEVGDRVVVNGSFLIDAETRLNPAAGSIYYGGSSGKATQGGTTVRPSTPEDEDARDKKIRYELSRLSPAERRLAEAQQFCPVQQKIRLGAMGSPVKVEVAGQPVFLCCAACEEKAKDNAKKTLEVVEQFKKGGGRPAPVQPPVGGAEAEISANLDKLPREDRPLAVEQKFCPVTEERLGDPTMGVPLKLLVKGQAVFLCCKGCEKEALKDEVRTLGKVSELKRKAKQDGHKHPGN